MKAVAFTTGLMAAAPVVQAATPAQWRSRSIYQVLTDRYAHEMFHIVFFFYV